MDIIQLYQDYAVNYVTEGHKHTRTGWVNTECPFCTGNPGYHLGYNIDGRYYYCWRCGWHDLPHTLVKLTGLSLKNVYAILPTYGGITAPHVVSGSAPLPSKEHRLPSGVAPLTDKHKAYLAARGYDPDQLVKTWQLIGTGPVATLDNIDFKHRIVIPIIWDNEQVSFTTRATNNNVTMRYISCPKARERIHHKNILYGKQDCWGTAGICVEGPFDVWRLGTNAFCTFGIEYKQQQVRLMAKAFKRIFVLFDDDPQAVVQAKKLVAELRFRGVEAILLESIIASDPAGMRQQDADHLIKHTIG